MNEKKRRAIVWDMIEHIAFRPITSNERSNWLSVYARTLHNLWGLDPIWKPLTTNDKFNVTFLNLRCKYSIESVGKYKTSFADDSSDSLFWRIHVDPRFESKASLQASVGKYPHDQKSELHRDVDVVLRGMLFHPRCYTHLEDLGVRHVQLDGGLSSQEIRIGGGIENPYVFLYHLRYQFCLVSSESRDDERARLITLFENAIRDRLSNVNPMSLFDFWR